MDFAGVLGGSRLQLAGSELCIADVARAHQFRKFRNDFTATRAFPSLGALHT